MANKYSYQTIALTKFKAINPLHFHKNHDEVVTAVQKIEEAIAHEFKKKDTESYISHTQLRNVFDLVKRRKNMKELKLLRVKLIYMAAKQEGNEGAKKIIIEITDQIAKLPLEEETALQAFKLYMEAILAYHKYYFKK